MIHRTGTITVGKEADFILLTKNPLEDIKSTRSIAGVSSANLWLNGEYIQKLLTEAKETLGR
jgi:imidazolonepropionase-like amidohydrolase